ncbi:MAG: aminotransferase class I/II-fold pyridoxal phosphate-dependent enzyme [Thermoplasmata archaeon]|jgi:aminotransferase
MATPPREEGSGAFAIADARVSDRVQHFPESVIREMTRLANRHGAINLSQGFPDFDPPEEILEAARDALAEGYNQYATTWGAEDFRQAIAESALRFQGLEVDPDAHVVVTCGATEAMMAAMLSLIDPGEEVVVLEPFYENYGPDAIVSGARPVFVPMEWPTYRLDEEALKAAFGRETKALILNTPNNPTGRVFDEGTLRLVADLCSDHDVVCVTDEIYEHIVYDGRRHVSIATLGGMWERTVTISGLSKTFSVTGWRLGYALSPRTLTEALKRTHDFLTVGAPHPLQIAGAYALRMGDSYFEALRAAYTERREVLYDALTAIGFQCAKPEGSYYIMADIRPLTDKDDVGFSRFLVEEVGVAVVPGSSFFADPADGRFFVRFAFPKRMETLREATKRLEKVAE